MKLIIFVLVLCSSVGLSAQATDMLHLQSGKVLVGELIDYSPNDRVVFKKADDGTAQTYPIEAVARIQQLPAEASTGEEWWILVPELEEQEVISTIELRDGTEHEGVVVAYERGGNIKLRMESGTTLTFAEKEVQGVTYELPEAETEKMERVVQRAALEPIMATKEKPVYEFRETGWFNNTSFAFSFGRREREEVIFFSPSFEEETVEMSAIGFNVQHITGYQFNRMVGVGLGASYDAYDLEDGESMVTVFGHYRAYLSKRIVAPFAAISAGYGFALRNEEQGVKETDGGLMFHPEIGLRLGATDAANFTVSLGYRIQDAYYVQERPFNGNIEYRDVRYQRFLFTLGLLF